MHRCRPGAPIIIRPRCRTIHRRPHPSATHHRPISPSCSAAPPGRHLPTVSPQRHHPLTLPPRPRPIIALPPCYSRRSSFACPTSPPRHHLPTLLPRPGPITIRPTCRSTTSDPHSRSIPSSRADPVPPLAPKSAADPSATPFIAHQPCRYPHYLPPTLQLPPSSPVTHAFLPVIDRSWALLVHSRLAVHLARSKAVCVQVGNIAWFKRFIGTHRIADTHVLGARSLRDHIPKFSVDW